MQNPANVIDDDTNNWERDLGNQLRDSRNQNLRFQHLLDESRVQAERITQIHTDALNDENRQRKDTQIAEHRRTAHRLTGQILALQNNPLGNMADTRRLPVLNLIAPILAKNKPYTGQEPSDDYLDRLIQSISFAEGHMTVLENANARDFDEAVKCNIYKAQMGGKYLPVPVNDPYNGNNPINTTASLRAWMRSKYQHETVGVADGDAQTVGFLKNHLSGDLYTWMRAVAPAGIDAFFTNLKDMWLERAPNLNGDQNYQNNSSAEIENALTFDRHLNQELEKRLGPRKVKQDINTSSIHNALSEKDNQGTKQVSLEEIIRKIIQIEFENYLPYIIQQVKKYVSVLAQDSDEEDILNGPMEINFIWKKEPVTDVVTIKCKIKRLVIPAGTVDPGANFLIMSEDISKQSKLVIDTKEKHNLRGIATTPTESLGIVRNVP
ncbi:hypothetical protein C1645_826189, partial [Glomus cerebriforme]